MHIYHYAAYEKTTLLRLAGRYGVGEQEVDQLLRDGVLVDLYHVVRACLRTGQRSYSLKKLEPLYMDAARTGQVRTAGESVVEYAQACDVRDAGRRDEWLERLDRIADYNAYDCLSTLRLRDWLLARVAPPEEADLTERLLAVAGTTSADRTADQQGVAMLAAALGYHRREVKPFWWAHFDRLVSDPAEWMDRRNTFLGERAEISPWEVPARAHTLSRRLRLVGRLEPSNVTEGAQVCAIYDPPLPECLATSVEGRRGWTDKLTVLAVEAEGTGADARDVVVVVERLGRGQDAHDAVPMALAPGRPPGTERIAAAIRGLAEDVAKGLPDLPDQPAIDLLRRRPPRTRGGALPVVGDGPLGYVEAITAATLDLDASYLAVQGPPGTGKTYTGARVIAALVERGWRIGVVAQSHAVVENMLREVAAAVMA